MSESLSVHASLQLAVTLLGVGSDFINIKTRKTCDTLTSSNCTVGICGLHSFKANLVKEDTEKLFEAFLADRTVLG